MRHIDWEVVAPRWVPQEIRDAAVKRVNPFGQPAQ